jgi:pSer/pThr/pTyr-binding forkhead associated (FHA) protein
MPELTLTWTENKITRIEKLNDKQPSKFPGTFRIGRDPAQCDIIISDPTVSGLHVEIFFNQQQHRFFLRNLRPTNPPVVDERSIIQDEAPLKEGSCIYLGQVEIKVAAVSVGASRVEPTIVMPHKPSENLAVNHPLELMKIDIDENKTSQLVAEIIDTDYFQQLQQLAHQFRDKNAQAFREKAEQTSSEVDREANASQPTQPLPTLPPQSEASGVYGSMCPHCYHVSPYKRDLWCTKCGTSLAAAAKVLMNPSG